MNGMDALLMVCFQLGKHPGWSGLGPALLAKSPARAGWSGRAGMVGRMGAVTRQLLSQREGDALTERASIGSFRAP